MKSCHIQEQEMADAEANYFAMNLLMPEEWVRREIGRMGGIDMCDDAAIKNLSKKFGVSQGIMAMRIGQIRNSNEP